MQSLSVDFGPFGFTHLDRLDKCQSTCYRKWLAFTKVKIYQPDNKWGLFGYTSKKNFWKEIILFLIYFGNDL